MLFSWLMGATERRYTNTTDEEMAIVEENDFEIIKTTFYEIYPLYRTIMNYI